MYEQGYIIMYVCIDYELKRKVDGTWMSTWIEVEGEVSQYYPAQTQGPADICHPAEGGDAEITRITGGEDAEWWDGDLQSSEENEILQHLAWDAQDG